jgi:hypothetical protein
MLKGFHEKTTVSQKLMGKLSIMSKIALLKNRLDEIEDLAETMYPRMRLIQA